MFNINMILINSALKVALTLKKKTGVDKYLMVIWKIILKSYIMNISSDFFG